MSNQPQRRRYVRFSIGAMLVVMTGVAVLINHEVQRAKAIETTVKRIEKWNGDFILRTRNIPDMMTKFLPKYWTCEIDKVRLGIYSAESPAPKGWRFPPTTATVDPSEFEDVLALGALNNLSAARLEGSAIRRDSIIRICQSRSIRDCICQYVDLSDAEIASVSQLVKAMHTRHSIREPIMVIPYSKAPIVRG